MTIAWTPRPTSANTAPAWTGDTESFAAPAKPLVEDASVDDVSSSWADFHGVLDPLGQDTTYHFEYVSAAAFVADGDSSSVRIQPRALRYLPGISVRATRM